MSRTVIKGVKLKIESANHGKEFDREIELQIPPKHGIIKQCPDDVGSHHGGQNLKTDDLNS